MSSKNKRNFNQEIIECLIDNNYGLTVLGIAEKIGASRNTVYKYLAKLEEKDDIFKREVGTYKLYYSTEGRLISRNIVLSFYKGILAALYETFLSSGPNPEIFSKIGRIIAEHIDIPFNAGDLQKLLRADKSFKLDDLNMLNALKPYFTLLHDKLKLKSIRPIEGKKKFIFRFVDSDLFEEEKAYMYHFYILTGIVEAKIAEFSDNIRCYVEGYKTSKEDKENYVEIALELKKNLLK